jgi:cell wall-associated NlpC family hydrolase
MAVENSSDGGWPVADSQSALSSNPGGALGTLGGTNNLQPSIDSLTRAVENLTSRIGTLSTGTAGQEQKNKSAPAGFPSVINPFSSNQAGPSTGIGGGGRGGAGNVASPSTFRNMSRGAAVSGIMRSFAGYGQQQMPVQLGLNAYATQTALAMGQTSGNFTQQYKQAFGFNNQNLNALASSPMDALAGTQGLQYLSSSPMYMSNQIGRAGYGAAAAFGMANPAMSFQQQVAQAQSVYSPQTALRMQMMGYGVTPRRLGGGANNMGQVVQGMLRTWYGQKNVNPSTLTAGLGEGGRVNANLQALGLNPTTMAPTIEEYNQLFSKGLTASQAQNLINSAGKNNAAGIAAQQKLSQLGVKTATSSMQQIRNNQSAVTGRDADIASGFASALSTSTGLLNTFNQGLSGLMSHLGLNGVVGGAGGAAGIFSGTGGGNALLGMGSSLSLLGLAGRGLFGGTPFASSLVAGGTRAAGLQGVGGALGSSIGMAGALGAGAALYGATNYHVAALGNKTPWQLGSNPEQNSSFGSAFSTGAGANAANSWGMDWKDITGWLSRITKAGMGGGAATVSTTSQQSSSTGSRQLGGNISGAAVQAVSAARSQVGVPYIYGEENPGVGFDCSGLTQWAYKQAGINLPRTSQEQWSALSKRAVALNAVQEGDLVFMAGSDGTPDSPGHVGMMISNKQLIQAPYTGADIQVVAYNPGQWSHAGRPSGRGGSSLAGSGSGANGSSGSTGANSGGPVGNMGLSIGGSYGSTEEVDAVTGALGSTGNFTSYGAAGNGTGSGGAGHNTMTGAGNIKGNKAIMQRWAARYGWGTGQEWSSLNTLEMHEAGYNNLAQNPGSTAFGMGQFLDTTWASVGGKKTSDPNLQAMYMMKYIKQRYGNPEKAWSQYYDHPGGVGYYGSGGIASDISVVGDRGPEIMIGGAGNRILDATQTAAILKAASAQPAQTPYSALSELNPGSQNAQQSAGVVHLNFNKGAVQIQLSGASASDASSSGRAIAQSFMQWLGKEDVYDAISKGEKNG